MKREFTIAFAGDIMLGRGVDGEIPRRKPESFWGSTLPLLRGADAVIANLECAITSSQQRWVQTPKMFHFGARPQAVKLLQAANIRAVSLANNHTLDYCETGLLDTLQALDAAGIAHAGAGRTLDEAEAPAYLRLNGLRLGITAATDNEPPFRALRNRPGTNFFDVEAASDPRPFLMTLAASARDRGNDLAILSLHWGSNMTTEPPAAFRKFARTAIDCGFDIVHGHSAHLFHGVEIYHERPILYDTGDFLDDYAVDETLRNDWSFLFLIDVAERQIERLRMVPVRLSYARVDLAEAAERDDINLRMTDRCVQLGTAVTVENGEVRIAVREAVAV